MYKYWIKMKKTLVYTAIIFTALACTNRGITPMGDTDSDYHRLLKSRMLSQKYYGIERVAYLTSIVYLSDDIRKAYVDEFARRYQSTVDEKTALLTSTMQDAQNYTDFVVIHFASDRKSTKLDASSPIWQIHLAIGNETKLKPTSVTKLPGEKRVLEYFYPSINQWSYYYLVRFPKQAPGSSLTLHLDSIDDNLTFHWNS